MSILNGFSSFTPHGFCLAWQPGLIWLMAGSDLLTAAAYFSIPAALLVFLRRRKDLAFRPLFGLFAAFILACGTTHILGAVTLWIPLYWLDGAIKGLTAILSVSTATVLWPLVPRALALPSPESLRALNAELALQIEQRDQTAGQLRESQARLRQAQKMEAVGQLTGGIAHDFNNLLTTIMGSLELLALRPGLDERGQQLAENAVSGARKAARLTSQLLSFSRRQLLRPEALMPADIVGGIQELLARSLREGITLSVAAPSPDLWPLLADGNQMEAALLNLVINARDAIKGQGQITIAFHNITFLQEDPLAPEGLGPGDYVAIHVTDTGCGMTEETRARAFEPFFTTKPAGAGTGLGLSQTYGFVQQSKGGLSIHSTPGLGTTVSMLLPRAGAALLQEQPVLQPVVAEERLLALESHADQSYQSA